jgi:hypothetical protein
LFGTIKVELLSASLNKLQIKSLIKNRTCSKAFKIHESYNKYFKLGHGEGQGCVVALVSAGCKLY